MNNKKRKIRLILAAILLFLMIAIYAVTVFHFRHVFYSGTTINGVDCTEKDAEEVKELLREETAEYTLTLIKEDGTTEILNADQLGLSFPDNGEVERLLAKQNSWFWIADFFADKAQELNAAVEVDEEKMGDAVEGLSCMQEGNYMPPSDAAFTETDTGYAVVPETEGNALDVPLVKEAVKQAVLSGERELHLKESGCYQKPSVYADDQALVERVAHLNQLVCANLTMDFGSGRTETVDTALLKTWLTQDEAGNDVIDQEKIGAYVRELAKKYNTYHTTRYFEKTGGGTAVLTQGDYGWLLDEETTAADLFAAVAEGRQGEFEVTYESSARSRALNDIGGSYVEISIAQQTMWCYVDGELLVETPVVTGCVSKGTETPSGGVWKVKTRTTDYTMTGEKDENGKPSYTAHCNYWVPFSEDLTIGLHDLVTRSAFGGDIYLTNGSHGCVNTPLDAMQKIYEAVSYGFPVVVY